MLVGVALRNVTQAKSRTLLLGFAIAAVTALFVILLALSAGIRGSFIESVGALTTGHVNVGGFFKASASSARAVVVDREQLVTDLEDVQGVERIVDRHRAVVQVFSLTDSMRVAVLTGIDAGREPELFDFLTPAAESEFVDGGADEPVASLSPLRGDDTALIFASQADRLGVSVGDVITVRSDEAEGGANAIDLRVAGIARDVGMLSRWTIFTTRDAILRLQQLKPTTTSIVQLYLDDPERSGEVMDRLRQALGASGWEILDHTSGPYYFKFNDISDEDWTGQKLDITTWRDDVSYLTWILGLLDAISVGVIAILLALVGIGIINTMMMATRERTREIGTLRAVGMKKSQVLWMILLEAAILGLVATSLGAAIGASVAFVVDAMEFTIPSPALRDVLLTDVMSLHVDLPSVLISVVALTLFTVLAAAWPAARAARLQPVTAIQQVE